MEPFIGEIRAFAFGIIPKGWALCDGSLLAVNQNQALYALLGNLYGGTPNQNFNLPDLRGRTPLGFNPTTPVIPPAQKDGSETVTLTAAQVPPHTHQVKGSSATASTNAPSTHAMAVLASGAGNAYAAPDAAAATLNVAAVATSGGSAPHPNMQPSLAVNWCIATIGLWPQRP